MFGFRISLLSSWRLILKIRVGLLGVEFLKYFF